MGKSSVKVEGGKMVQIEKRGSEIRFTGDFFIQPPEARERIERKLENLGEEVSRKEVLKAVKSVDAELIGFSAKDITEAFIEAQK